MIDRPVRKNRSAVNKLAGHSAKNARVIRTDAVVAHDEVTIFRNADGTVIARVFVLRRHVRLVDGAPVDINDALANLDIFAGQTNDAFNKRLRMVQRIPEDDNIAALNGFEPINKFVDEDAFLIREQGRHAGTFNFYRLIEEDYNDEGQTNGNEKIASPNTDFVSQGMGCRRRRCWSFRNRWGKRLVLVHALHFVVPSIYNTGIAGRARLDFCGALTDCRFAPGR